MGREEHCKQISLACVGHAYSEWNILGLPQLMAACAFPVYTAQAPGCSAGELSKAGTGLHALLRSKPLRFRFLGTPQKQTRLGLCFVPFPGLSTSGVIASAEILLKVLSSIPDEMGSGLLL